MKSAMKSATVVSTSLLALLLGTAAVGGAQNGPRGHEGGPHGHEGEVRQHGDPHPSQHGNHEARGPEYRHEPSHQSREAVRRGPEHPSYAGHPGPVHEARRPAPSPRYVRQDIWQRQRARNWRSEHRSWHDRGGYRGYRIPEDRFRGHFGRGHWFRVHEVPILVVEGHPRFQYGGYWFSVVDPCPETWSPVWYRTDDVYVDYVNDGYYMYNRAHPGIAIAINVSL